MNATGERTQVLRRLSRSGETYRFLFSGSYQGVLLVGEGVEDCNDAACLLLGRTRGQLLGANPLRLAPPAQRDGSASAELARQRLEAALAGRTQWFEWRFSHEDGSVVDTLLNMEAVEVDGTKRLLLRIRDITHLERSEEALRGAALAVSTAEGDSVFRDLVRHLAAYLETDLAFIALPSQGDRCRLRMLAFYLDGKLIEDFEYPIAGTPCETVLGQRYRLYPSGLTQRFPMDEDFKALGLNCYAGCPLNDAHGAPLGLIAVVSRKPFGSPDRVESLLKIFAARAVTEIERRRSDQALRSAEASYRAIFDAAEDPIFVHDWDTGAIVDVNRKACEVYGYSYDELRGIRLRDIGSGEPGYTEADALNWIEQAKRAGAAQFEWRRRNRDGSLHWDEVRLKSAVISDRPCVLAYTRDITERKRAEETLLASEEQYRTIFNASVDGLLLKDADHRIVDVNEAYLSMHGYRREALIGKRLSEFIPADLQQRCETLLPAILVGEPCHLEARTQRSDGSALDVEIHGVPMQYRGRPHALITMRDITESKRAQAARAELEAQLRQAQKMEAIGHLTGGIAHDFNNILASIMGYIALAADRPQVAADAKLERYLEQAQIAVRRGRDLIQQMLTFSRGQRGEPRSLVPASMIESTVKLLRSMLPSSVEVETALARDLARVMIDPVQIEQVLLNLCINARDAMVANGRISVQARTRDIRAATCASCRQQFDGRYVGIAVGDNGVGIAPEVRERMFEPFFSTKDVGKGSGMGLATVHGIVHEYGGHVCVDSTPGVGSTFTVLLPALQGGDPAAAEQAVVAESAVRRAPRLTGRVLVVDDEAMVADMMTETLRNWGLDVTVMHNPVGAEQWFLQDPARVDLVLTDLTMPKLTGLDLAQRLTLVRPDLPVVLCSGYGIRVTNEDAARSGICALIAKPVEPSALFGLLRAHLPDTQ